MQVKVSTRTIKVDFCLLLRVTPCIKNHTFLIIKGNLLVKESAIFLYNNSYLNMYVCGLPFYTSKDYRHVRVIIRLILIHVKVRNTFLYRVTSRSK